GFQQLDGGALTLGTKTPSTWLIKAAGVDDLHLDVTMAPNGDSNDVLLEHRSTSAGKVSDVSAGGKTVRLDAANPSLTATLPLTLTLGELATGSQNKLTGTAQVMIRRGKVFEVR